MKTGGRLSISYIGICAPRRRLASARLHISATLTSAKAAAMDATTSSLSPTLRRNHLSKGLHKLLHLFERTNAQSKAAVNHRFVPHIPNQDAFRA